MSKIENKDFWEKEEIIKTQETVESAADYEYFLFDKVKENPKKKNTVDSVKIFGCGTGREVKAIADYFSPEKIVASDISENMISKCQVNLKTWKIDQITETVVINAADYKPTGVSFDLVTILNSMLTYVPLRKDRIQIFKNSYSILNPDGILIGTVHHQVGSPAKTNYFRLRKLFSFFLGEKVGNRNTGFNGFKVPGYYYDKATLISDIRSVGFSDIEVWSLEDFYRLKGKAYDAKKGYNNLIFIARKKK
jgi:SAM-dependent methyltransferase